MCYVPPGEFIMGGNEPYDGRPEHVQSVADGFWIGKHPITNAQFKLFMDAGGYRKPDLWSEAIAENSWKEGRLLGGANTWVEGPRQYREPFGQADHPVVGVSWYEALAFTRWLRERLGIGSFGLPSEAQWEYAARGPRYAPKAMTPMIRAANAIQDVPPGALVDFGAEIKKRATFAENRRSYPWGDDADSNRMNYSKTRIWVTSPVGAFPAGMSLFGCLDMAGNVGELTTTKATVDYQDYATVVDDRLDAGEVWRILRGGSFYSIDWQARCASRAFIGQRGAVFDLGFRVIASLIHL